MSDPEIEEGGDSNGGSKDNSGGNPFKGLRILVVDDNKDDLHALGSKGCKRNESDSEEVNQPHSHKNRMKKPRLVWTDERKNRFLEILQRFGEKNLTPTRIAELMNEPELTNVHVSSHLQKYRLGLKKAKDAAAAAAASVQQGGKNSESSERASSARVGINDPIQINTEDIDRQIARYSQPNAASWPIVNGPSSRFLFENMRMQPYVGFQWITPPGRGFNQHAQPCIRRPGLSDELAGRTLNFGQLVMNRDIVIGNQVLYRSLPLEWQAPGLGERPSGYCIGHGHCGVENLEWSRDVSCDPISSVLRVRQTNMDGGILGTTEEKGESSQGNWNAQNNGTEDPVGNGAPNVDKSPEDSTAKTPSSRSSDSRADTNHPETTDGEEADHSAVTCHCKYG